MEILTLTPGFIYLENKQFSTLIFEADSGKEKRRNKWPTGTLNGATTYTCKRSFRVNFKSLNQTELNIFLQFLEARGGRKEAFYWENINESPILRPYPNKIIIDASYAGANTSQIAHYPIIADTQYIYDDGTLLTEGVDYSIVDSTGVITWINKPVNGSVVRGNYRFYREVRFDTDEPAVERVAYGVYNVEVMLKETAPRL